MTTTIVFTIQREEKVEHVLQLPIYSKYEMENSGGWADWRRLDLDPDGTPRLTTLTEDENEFSVIMELWEDGDAGPHNGNFLSKSTCTENDWQGAVERMRAFMSRAGI